MWILGVMFGDFLNIWYLCGFVLMSVLFMQHFCMRVEEEHYPGIVFYGVYGAILSYLFTNL